MKRPNFLIILVDEQRYPPIYENQEIMTWRKNQLFSEYFLREHGLEFKNHYIGSTACAPSRGTIYTGQYPSLHGVSQTNGTAKMDFDPDMFWLDPNTVPTIGDYLRANGYSTYWKGKWHASQADIIIPGTHDSLLSFNNMSGIPNINNTNIYKNADKLSKYGFEGWIGPEPFGRNPCNTGGSSSGEIPGRDTVYSKEVSDLINELNNKHQENPWAIVASFVNPHDIAIYGEISRRIPQFDFKVDASVPYIPPAPTAKEDLKNKPRAQKSYKEVFQKAFQPTVDTKEYRRLYYSLQLQVDREIKKVLESLVRSKFYENTITIFTSDHGELLGAHGGLFQKWYNAYEETIHVPFIIHNPRLFENRCCTELLTSHLDVLPTILGLANIDEEKTLEVLKQDHTEARPLVGRNLKSLILGSCKTMKQEPIYFTTDDNVTKGLHQVTLFGESYASVISPNNVETVIAYLNTGKNGKYEKWKLSRYYDNDKFWTSPGRLDRNLVKTVNEKFNSVSYFSIKREPDKTEYEMYNITRDPLEILNLANNLQQGSQEAKIKMKLIILLNEQRKMKRLYP
jgi:arylsulfatase A-like enzyme